MKRTRAVFLALLCSISGSWHAEARDLGDSRVVAQLPPAPGYPEGIAVRGSTLYVATAARFGTAVIPPKGPPEVQAFDAATGAPVAAFAIADDDPMADHGTSGLAFDAAGRLYVLDTQWGIVRFDPSSAPTVLDPSSDAALIYATAFPDLPPCNDLGIPCSPTLIDAPPLPNDIAFGPDGTAYISDSLQATIWRVAPGGGEPQIWFQDARLGGGFGVNGLRLDPTREHVVVSVTIDAQAAGVIYRIPIEDPAAMETMHRYALAEAPDNIAFGESGRLYVALAGSNQISVLAPEGSEIVRYSGPAVRADGSTVPYDMPSGVALDPGTRTLLANNHSEVLGLPPHFVVFDVAVDDGPDPLIEPEMP